jgi:hypothetical protein
LIVPFCTEIEAAGFPLAKAASFGAEQNEAADEMIQQDHFRDKRKRERMNDNERAIEQ